MPSPLKSVTVTATGPCSELATTLGSAKGEPFTWANVPSPLPVNTGVAVVVEIGDHEAEIAVGIRVASRRRQMAVGLLPTVYLTEVVGC